ncbi:MAG: response regulator [Alphaproteobacteria bacterium]|jgi:CheY-like chemotaxis protein|nr:two-component system response regulator [Rhodobiaceae bacterium]MBO6541913.1 response regulator [Alphaproteobacteria bacterium]MBO6628083.1 response regulator [Alphaproteobacteria bacterium]MDF1625231.1 response regulator [Parvibaculaceae bacterium]
MTTRSTAYGKKLEELDVLIVDDNTHMRKLVNTILHAFDLCKLREAKDGSEALAEISFRMPDLVISDWEMKPMDGCAFLEELRKVENKPACFIPVIMLTAHGRPNLIRRAFDAGASQFLVKPLTPANLLHRIEWIVADERPFFEEEGHMRQQMTLRLPKAAVAVAEQKVAQGSAWDLDI